MNLIEKTVFVSYRRTNIPWALAIFQNLTQHGFDVFFDYNGIASGDFERVILGNIKARAHFLVLLTPSALKRCREPGDWLRREIETAIENKRNIVPVMLEDFDFSSASIATQLTGALSKLKKYNGLPLPPAYFNEAMDRLRYRYLNVALTGVLHPASRSAKRAATKQKVLAERAPKVRKIELTAQEWFERGFAATDPDKELRYFTEAIRLHPDYALAFYNRGVVRHDHDVEGAISDYSEAIRLNPHDAEALYNRGLARHDSGDLPGAIRDYSKAIRLKPEDADAFNNRGLARHDNGDIRGAIRDYSEVIRLNPNCVEAFNSRGLALRERGDNKGAIRDFAEAIRRKPEFTEAFYNRGLEYHDAGNLDAAIRDYTEAIRLRPDYAEAFNNRGIAHYEMGSLATALTDYNQSIRLDRANADAYYNRGLISEAKTKYKAAIDDYKKYLVLGGGLQNGDQGKVKRAIRDLNRRLQKHLPSQRGAASAESASA
jgi:tetratricopeptide (TPR) repeat protein